MSGIKFDIGLYTENFQRGLAQVKQSVESTAGVLNSRLGRIAGFTTVLYAFKRLATSLNEINDNAIKLNVTTATIQKMDYAAKVSGTSLGSVEGAIRRITKNLYEMELGGEAGEKIRKSFELLGLTFEDLKGMKVDELLPRIGEQLNKINDPKLKMGIIQELAGRGGGRLLGFFERYNELSQELEQRGGIVSDSAIQAADDLDDAFTSILASVKTIASESKVFETIASGMKFLLEGFQALNNPDLPPGMTSTITYKDKNFSELTWAERAESLRNNWGPALLGPAGAGYAVAKTLFGKTRVKEESFSYPATSESDLKKAQDEKNKLKQMAEAYANLGADKSIEKEKKKTQAIDEELALLKIKNDYGDKEYAISKIIIETTRKIAEAKTQELKEAERKLGQAKLNTEYQKQSLNERDKTNEIKSSTVLAKKYNEVLTKQISQQEYEIYSIRAKEAQDLADADKEKASQDRINAIKEKALADIANVIAQPNAKYQTFGKIFQAGDLEAIKSAQKDNTKTLQEKSLEYQRETAEGIKEMNRKQTSKAIYG